jgi:hypothetical protein
LKILLRLKKAALLIIMMHALAGVVLGCIFIMKGKPEKAAMVMGAVLLKDKSHEEQSVKEDTSMSRELNERYFRPSKLPALNLNKEGDELLNKFFGVSPENIELPKEIFKKPWEVVLNYYSVLREAANMQEGKAGGCGTVGWQQIPYPIAYNFLSTDYKKKVDYNDYLQSFKGIVHINLVKLRNVTNESTDNGVIKYFVELEALKSSEKGDTYFAYYYGNLYLKLEEGLFKISNIELYGEDFLCAAYHGWRYQAENYMDVTYGNWCKLIEKRLPTVQEGYLKNIDIKGTDGKEYRFQFIQLTNGVDIEVGQYVKDKEYKWENVKIDPEKCLDKN